MSDLKEIKQLRNPKTRFNAISKRSGTMSKCSNCGTINHKYKKSPLSIDYEIQDPNLPRPGNDPKQTLWPEEAQRILSNITEEHLECMGLNKKTSDPANMIIDNLAVAPPPVRPSVSVTGSTRSEDDLTVAYRAIIEYNNFIRKGITGGLNESQIKELRKQLQFRVATVMDNDISGTGT
jgi:DNA-directed RNA polymerase II subunit RPB1